MKINKAKLLEQLKSRLQAEKLAAKEAYDSSRTHATEAELKAEGKYDTRSIEAGYLAGAQKKRLDELELELGLLDEMNLDHRNDSVSVGSLVEMEHNQIKRWYFISSTSGGAMLSIDEVTILCISAFSPIGTEAIGLEVGESFEVKERSYTIRDIR